MKLAKKNKILANILLILGLGMGVVSLQKPELEKTNQTLTKEHYLREEEREKVSINLLQKIPSFGFDNLIADWAFIKFIIYFGDGDARKETGYSVTPEYFKIIVDREPKFVKAYFFLSPATSLFAGRPEITTSLIDKGLKSINPETSNESYFLWIYKAVDEILFLGDNEAARNSYEMASKWADIVADERSKAVGQRTRQMAKFMSTNPDSTTARIGSWFMLLTNARDNFTRQQAVTNIEKLGGKIIIHPNGAYEVKVPEANS